MLPVKTPQLETKIQLHVRRIRKAIEYLDLADPVRAWCEHELRALAGQSNHRQLGDGAASLHAMRQLKRLLIDHVVRLRNPCHLNVPDISEESVLTIAARNPSAVFSMSKDYRFSIDPDLMFHPSWKCPEYDPVSPTAKVVGYLRSRDSRLQVARELRMEEEGRRILDQADAADHKTVSRMAALFQARHHAINVAIAGTGTKQVVELAAGLSPRGLHWASSMPDTIYIESDLPGLMIHKAKLLRNHILDSARPNVGHLHCCSIDVQSESSWQPALDTTDRDSLLVIVSEGLLLYFDESELERFMQQIRNVLLKHPRAVWVTDLVTQENLQHLLNSHPRVAQAVRRTFGMTGRSVIADNPLTDDSSILGLTTAQGLKVQSTVRLADCSSNANHSRIVGDRKIWVLGAA